MIDIKKVEFWIFELTIVCSSSENNQNTTESSNERKHYIVGGFSNGPRETNDNGLK